MSFLVVVLNLDLTNIFEFYSPFSDDLLMGARFDALLKFSLTLINFGMQ